MADSAAEGLEILVDSDDAHEVPRRSARKTFDSKNVRIFTAKRFWTSITINRNKSRWNRSLSLVLIKISTSSEVLVICAASIQNCDIPTLLRRLELQRSIDQKQF